MLHGTGGLHDDDTDSKKRRNIIAESYAQNFTLPLFVSKGLFRPDCPPHPQPRLQGFYYYAFPPLSSILIFRELRRIHWLKLSLGSPREFM